MTDDSIIRRPRVRLILNGVPIIGCRSAEVAHRGGHQAGSFRVSASLSDTTLRLGRGWMDQDQLDVAIDFGLLLDNAPEGAVQWVRMLTGTADRLSIDQVNGIVGLEGRDHAARLIDLALQDNYQNKTSSELAVDLADRCNLTSHVQSTTTLIGQYYQIQHTKLASSGFSRHPTGWDLLAELADLEGFSLWIDGDGLYFQPPSTGDDDIFQVAYSGPSDQQASSNLTISDLSMERAMGLSGAMQVTVTSWNSRQRRQIACAYPSALPVAARQFFVVKPNLLPDEAENLAKATYARLRTHQRLIMGRMAGELVLTPRHRLHLLGTGTAWDTVYTIDRIEREMSLDGGFIQHITARIDSALETNDE